MKSWGLEEKEFFQTKMKEKRKSPSFGGEGQENKENMTKSITRNSNVVEVLLSLGSGISFIYK